MEQICGTLEVRHLYLDSKSEGDYAFLLLADGQEYQLARPDVFPMNDSYFAPFHRQYVCIEGHIHGEFLTVSSVVPNNPQPQKEKETPKNEDMH